MNKSKIFTLCVLLIFISVLEDTGSAKIKNPLKKIDNPFDKKDDKKKKQQKSMLEASNNAQINAQKEAQIKAMSDQLAGLKNPEGLDDNARPQKLKETSVAGTKQESKEQGKTIDGSPVTYITTTERFKASAAFDQQILLNPGTDVIYPGSVLLGHTIASGTYKEITKGKKNSINLSYDLTNIKNEQGKSGKVTGNITPSLSNYRNLHNEITGQNLGKASTTYSFEETTVYSESDFNVKFNFGVGFNSGVVETKVKTGFDFGKGSKKYKYMVKFMETFYTVDVDQGKDTFIYESFDIKDFQGYRPVYVASVAYGRLAYLTIESDETWDKIKADLDVAVDASMYGQYDAKFESSVNNLKKNSKINITVIGGSTVAVNLDGFLNMLKTDGFSRNNPGKIIAYKLRFVDDNSIANTVYNDEYTLTKTVEQPGKGIDVTFTLYRIKTNANDGAGKAMELFGNLEIADDISKNKKSLWSYSKSSPQKVKEKNDNIVQNSAVTFRVPNENAKFDLYLNLSEKDDTNVDRFTDASEQIEGNTAKAIMLNSVEDGKDIIIKSYAIGKKKRIIRSEWIEYYIRVNKKYQY